MHMEELKYWILVQYEVGDVDRRQRVVDGLSANNLNC